MQQAAQAEAQEHVVEIDGQFIPLDPETAATDENVRQALRGIYPDIATATITRRTEGWREVIAVVKRAGPKGAWCDGGDVERVLAALHACAPAENPAVKLDRELRVAEARTDGRGEVGADERDARRQIEDAILRGEEDAHGTARALKALVDRQPSAGHAVPVGF